MAGANAERAGGQTGPGATDDAAARVVLIADDDPDILETLGNILEGQLKGVRVVTARTGLEALRIVRSEPIDLLVTDYRMPSMNGVDLIRCVGREQPTLPNILMTAYAADVEREIGQGVRLDGFFRKPLDPDSFVERIRTVLGLDG